MQASIRITGKVGIQMPGNTDIIQTGPVGISQFRSATVSALVFVAFCACTAQSQQQPATAVEGDQSGGYTLRSNVRRVVVDVVVTDAKGHVVRDLPQLSFQVLEDGKPQTIRSFDAFNISTEPTYVPPKIPPLPPHTFLNLAKAPQIGAPTVLLYDVLNTPLDAQPYAHAAMVKFIKQDQHGKQLAIFVLGAKLSLLQGFTDDSERLLASIDKASKPNRSLLLQGPDEGAEASSGLAETEGNGDAAGTSTDTSYAQVLGMMSHMESIDRSDLLDRRVEITLDAITEIGRFLGGLPGRKNLIWLSGSFPAGIMPDPGLEGSQFDHDQSLRNYSAQLKQAADLLDLSHVAVYPVDIRGLKVNPMFSAASRQTFQPGSRIPKDIQAVQAFSQRQATEHATMDSIALDTGGRAFYNTNGLEQAVTDAVTEGSTYYSLSYDPSNRVFDGKLRKIKVDVGQPGYQLSYRRTYFADDLGVAAQQVADAPVGPLSAALEHGIPVSHELFFEAHVDAVGATALASPEQMKLLSQYEAMSFKRTHTKNPPPPAPVMLQHYVIQYGLVAHQLELPVQPDGTHHTSLEFGVISYDADGLKLNGVDTKVDDAIPPARYARLDKEGYIVVQSVAVPVGATSLRLAVRDALANHIGSLELSLPLSDSP